MNYARAKTFTPTAPDKGSFPLDHEGECKLFMVKHLRCLRLNENENAHCRATAKDYLACRMDSQLMLREDFSKLGYNDSTPEVETSATTKSSS